ncbi:hypothetical protein [Streptomyces sp. ISL-94]|uniref:hypothetical protein n=1 Tax=Streptomyces sp. ISL-94 TaxID=2819190 RepID=UPI001BECFAE7|nr:hypothetical protein [Streptomyces sp. ISL-94]MBT2477591.1 hypothetical protein [Streptomyces sp. ISL-94]
MTIRIGRLRIEVYESAVYLQLEPKPRCKTCHGTGRTDAEGQGIDTPPGQAIPPIEICHCWNPWGSKRIPLRRRTVITERYPF